MLLRINLSAWRSIRITQCKGGQEQRLGDTCWSWDAPLYFPTFLPEKYWVFSDELPRYLTRSRQCVTTCLKQYLSRLKNYRDILNFVNKYPNSFSKLLCSLVYWCTQTCFSGCYQLPVSYTNFMKFCSSVSPPPPSLLHPVEHTKMPLSFIITLRGLNTICEQWVLNDWYPLVTAVGSGSSQTRSSDLLTARGVFLLVCIHIFFQ